MANHEQQPGTHTPSSDLAVELRDVSKLYGAVRALDDVSMGIKRGEFFCLLGPSGCGKTTTLNIVGGFIPLSHGHVFIDGKDVTDDPPYRRAVNTVFQNYALFPHMSVAQNIGFGLRMKKVPPTEIEQRVQEMLRLVSLEWAGNRGAKQLSGGQQQRVALVRALVNRPGRAAPGRAARRARPQAAQAAPGRAAQHPAPGRHHLHPCHARPGRGHVHVGPHRGHERRQGGPDRLSRRHLLSARRRASWPTSSAKATSSPAVCWRSPRTGYWWKSRASPGRCRPVRRPFASVGADVTVMVRPERIRLSTEPPARRRQRRARASWPKRRSWACTPSFSSKSAPA